MIPYYRVDYIPFLGSDSFSFFFFMAFLSGYLFGLKRCMEKGLTFMEVNEFFCFTFIPACFGAHFFHLIAYAPSLILSEPGELLKLNKGLASMGGLLSYLFFFYLFIKFKKSTLHWKEWLDCAAQGFIVGLLVGRIGCTLIHDHIGSETTFFLGLQYPSGAVRHDLGFYELLYLSLVILPASLWAHKNFSFPGSQSILFACLYAPARFMFDFLRMGEIRYYGLTPAQYACLALLLCGFFIAKPTGISLKTGFIDGKNPNQC